MNLHTSCKLRLSLDLKGYSRENWREMSDLYHKIGILIHTGQNIMCYQVLYTEKLYKCNYNACHILTAKVNIHFQAGCLISVERKYGIWNIKCALYAQCFLCILQWEFVLFTVRGMSKTTCTVLKFLYLYSFESLALFDLMIWSYSETDCDFVK